MGKTATTTKNDYEWTKYPNIERIGCGMTTQNAKVTIYGKDGQTARYVVSVTDMGDDPINDVFESCGPIAQMMVDYDDAKKIQIVDDDDKVVEEWELWAWRA